MSLWTLPFVFSAFWITIHTVHTLLKPSRSLLPTPYLSSRGSSWLWNASGTKVVLSSLRLQVQTTAWNLKHDSLANSIARRRNKHVKASLTFFYDAGCVFSVLGMICALALLLWTCAQTGLSLIEKFRGLHPASTVTIGLTKRDLGTVTISSTTTASFLKPIIPGVTVPLSHLPSALVAVFFGQIVHEAGHGICAALESVPMLSTGASFIVFIPSAFVTLSTASLDSLMPLSRLRIIAAGPYHNLVFWCLLVAAGKTGIAHMIWSIAGYRDMSSSGRVVVNVNKDSALHRHLPSGVLIIALDDVALGISLDGVDTWSSYLIGWKRPPETEIKGWCIDEALYLASLQTCCVPLGGLSPLSCFKSLESPSELRCLDPVPVLTQPENNRCTSAMKCAEHSLCVLPRSDEQLLRITIQLPFGGEENHDIILWRGPRHEIWEEVQVGKFLPHFSFMPIWLPLTIGSFMEYLGMATLSLYMFNLLPLPLLDGAQLLVLVLDSISQANIDASPMVDIENGLSTSRRRRDHTLWKHVTNRFVTVFTSAALGLCVTFMLLNLI